MFKAPRKTRFPPLRTILENIPRSNAEIAKFLEIAPRTLNKYRKKDQAPRLVMLALFWETVWGQSAVNADAVNQGQLYFQENHMLKRQNLKLMAQIEKLEAALAEVDKAGNAPFFEIR